MEEGGDGGGREKWAKEKAMKKDGGGGREVWMEDWAGSMGCEKGGKYG